MGFVIDESVLSELRRLTALEVSLWRAGGEREPLLASTLPQQERNELQTEIGTHPTSTGDSVQDLALGTNDYMALKHPLATAAGSRFLALLQRNGIPLTLSRFCATSRAAACVSRSMTTVPATLRSLISNDCLSTSSRSTSRSC